jgi:hypothetical protein
MDNRKPPGGRPPADPALADVLARRLTDVLDMTNLFDRLLTYAPGLSPESLAYAYVAVDRVVNDLAAAYDRLASPDPFGPGESLRPRVPRP